MAMAALYSRELDRAELHYERAIALNPLDVSVAGDRANWLVYAGRLNDALQSVTNAIQRDSFAPVFGPCVARLCFTFDATGKPLKHSVIFPKTSEGLPTYLTATLALMSDIVAAAREADKIAATLPGSTVTSRNFALLLAALC
jgi:hypothetical protein